MDFFPETFVAEQHAEVLARGLYAVARAEDGVHEREAAMITSFLGESTGGGGLTLSALEKMPDPSPDMVAATFASPELKSLFLKSCILLGYVDGNFGPKERELVDGYAKAMAVGKEQLGGLEQSVKEYLVAQLSHLKNVQAVVEIAKDLKL